MVGLLHSRMAPAEKKAVMDLFKEGLVGVLVGEFSGRGYGRRIMFAAIWALVVRLGALGIGGAAADNPAT